VLTSKVCSECREEKPEAAFSVRKESGRLRSECKACGAARARVYRADNLDLVRQRNADFMQRYYRGNAAAIRERARERYVRIGREEQRARIVRLKADFFRWRVQFIRRHNQSITVDQIKALWDSQDGRCGLTGRPLTPANAELDHIIPRKRGGSSELDNLRWVCVEANRAKRDLLDEEFLALCTNVVEWIGRRLLAQHNGT
jgi:5-methylcytosine-specific restriction endonuclease McrA